MKSDTALDYAIFHLSPKRSRCELFVSGEGKTEKLASGLVKPFVSHLKVVEEQFSQGVQSIKLEVAKQRNASKWFTKGTLERFVRFVSTPEVLELVNTFYAEISQLVAARRLYSQGAAGDEISGENEAATAAPDDITKKELLRAIDVRLDAVKQDLTAACARASAAGFTLDNVSELFVFADQFGAPRLIEACGKFISLCQCQPELLRSWKGISDQVVRSSSGSDMSVDESEEMTSLKPIGNSQPPHYSYHCNQEHDTSHVSDSSKPAVSQPKVSTFVNLPLRRSLREPSNDYDECRETEVTSKKDKENKMDPSPPPLSSQQPARRLSVQDRINMFENKQKEHSGSSGSVNKAVVGKVAELRRLSNVSSSSAAGSAVVEKAVLWRWSGASDMSVELSGEKTETHHSESTMTPCSSMNSQTHTDVDSLNDTQSQLKLRSKEDFDDSQTVQFKTTVGGGEDYAEVQEHTSRTESAIFPFKADNLGVKDQNFYDIKFRPLPGMTLDVNLQDQAGAHTQLEPSLSGAEHMGPKDQGFSHNQFGASLNRLERTGSSDRVAFHTQSSTLSISTEETILKYSTSSHVPSRALLSKANDVGPKNRDAPQMSLRGLPKRFEDVGLKDQLASQIQLGFYPSKAQEVRLKSKDSRVSQFPLEAFRGNVEESGREFWPSRPQYKQFAGRAEELEQHNASNFQSQWRTFPGITEEVGKKGFPYSQAQLGAFPTKLEESGERVSGIQGTKMHGQISASGQNKKFQAKQDQGTFLSRVEELSLMGRTTTETPEKLHPALMNCVEPVQKVRLARGNQELNGELQMKANELEKPFAAHKLRVPGDQMASAWRSKIVDVQIEQTTSVVDKKLSKANPTHSSSKNQVSERSGNFSDIMEFDVNSHKKMTDNQENGNYLKQSTNFGQLEDMRGKFYEKYMQKRDAKLREESVSKKAQKEAKMKAMHNSLEHSKAQLKSKFSPSVGGQDFDLNDHRRADRLKSLNIHAAMKKQGAGLGFGSN